MPNLIKKSWTVSTLQSPADILAIFEVPNKRTLDYYIDWFLSAMLDQ